LNDISQQLATSGCPGAGSLARADVQAMHPSRSSPLKFVQPRRSDAATVFASGQVEVGAAEVGRLPPAFEDSHGNHRQFRFIIYDSVAPYGVLRMRFADEVRAVA
jgi:hypothetical protein